MCGRYNLITDSAALLTFFQVFDETAYSLEYQPRYNIAPSQNAPVILSHGPTLSLQLFKWGLVPFWAKDAKIGYRMINARAETIAEKPAFRAAFKKRRCLIPVTGFYEWKQTDSGKQPCHIHLHDRSMFALAGLWEHWKNGSEEIRSFTIITTTANRIMSTVHERMPAILSPDNYHVWLENGVQGLLKPYPDEAMRLHPVSAHVNNPRNEDSACIGVQEV